MPRVNISCKSYYFLVFVLFNFLEIKLVIRSPIQEKRPLGIFVSRHVIMGVVPGRHIYICILAANTVC